MKIIALNLPRDLTKEELEDLFKPYGAVESATLVLDKVTGRSKGFGFVEIRDELEAQAAISALHGSNLHSNKIRVKVASDAGKEEAI